MKKIRWLIAFACLAWIGWPANGLSQAEMGQKVDAGVWQAAQVGETEFIVLLKEQADLSQAANLPDKLSKGRFVFAALQATAGRTQEPLIKALTALNAEVRPYWAANMIWVRGGSAAVQAMAGRADVAHLYANPSVKLDAPEYPPLAALPEEPQGIEWNLLLVNADDVWAAGYTGQGAVVGGADTGYQWGHPALKNQYRGWNGQGVDHNYNWHDAIHADHPNTSVGNPCGFNSTQPCDDYGHGTHTMGILVGDDGAGNRIGMAPGARWVGCRNMEQGWGSPITYAECYQWFIAPTDLNNQNPDPTRAPDVINNSWSCPPAEGCTNPEVLRLVVENVRAAGILTVHSAGNSGPACSTVRDPAAIYQASFTVGNSTASSGLSSSSSRGPVLADGSGRLKPDVTAPGTGIRSSYPVNSYTWLSGTSMAAPHVAGMAALLISANPALAGNVDLLERWITRTALPMNIPLETCGGIPSTRIPNNSFGWGRIDAWGPFAHHLQVSKSATPAAIKPGESLTYTLSVTHTHLFDPTQLLVLSDTLPAQTSFLEATQPYTLDGNVIRWERAELEPEATWQVQLVVQASKPLVAQIENSYYSVSSQEVPTPVQGLPVLTPAMFQYYLLLYFWAEAP